MHFSLFHPAYISSRFVYATQSASVEEFLIVQHVRVCYSAMMEWDAFLGRYFNSALSSCTTNGRVPTWKRAARCKLRRSREQKKKTKKKNEHTTHKKLLAFLEKKNNKKLSEQHSAMPGSSASRSTWAKSFDMVLYMGYIKTSCLLIRYSNPIILLNKL